MTGLAEGIDKKAPQVKSAVHNALSPIQKQTTLATTAPAIGGVGSQTSYGDIHITIPVKDLAQVQNIHDLFMKIQQTARAGQQKRAVTTSR
jgi:hypothetical protein